MPEATASSSSSKKQRQRQLAIRIQAVTLRCIANFTNAQVTQATGLSERAVQKLIARAQERGFDPACTTNWLDEWFEDAPRSGRPSKQTEEVKNEVNKLIRFDRYAREKSCEEITADLKSLGFQVAPMTVWRMLKATGNRKTKPTSKPGLSEEAKKARLAWCLDK